MTFGLHIQNIRTISQFYSDISSFKSRKEMKLNEKLVAVNSPLIHNKGIYYYQTDWNLTGLRFQTTNKSTNSRISINQYFK